MKDYVARFRAMVEELRAHPEVAVTRFHMAPPVSEEVVASVQAGLGFALSDEILDFYRQANGLSLQWFPSGADGFEEGATPVDEPFESVPEDGYQSGTVWIWPLEQLLEDHPEELWFDFMEDEPMEFFHDAFEGKDYTQLAFHHSLRAVDYFDGFRLAAFALIDREPDPPIVFGDDHGADFQTFPPVSFAAYLETVLAIRGSYRQRVRRFFVDPPSRELPIPSLNEIVAECQMDEEAWGEQLAAAFDDEDD